PLGIGRDRAVEDDARHLPVACRGVFAGGEQRGFAIGALGGARRNQTGERPNVSEAEADKVGRAQAAPLRDVAERVAARIAVGRGVRHRADAYTVERDQYDWLE